MTTKGIAALRASRRWPPLSRGQARCDRCGREADTLFPPAFEAVIQSRKKLEFGVLSLGFGPRVLYNPISGGSGGPL